MWHTVDFSIQSSNLVLSLSFRRDRRTWRTCGQFSTLNFFRRTRRPLSVSSPPPAGGSSVLRGAGALPVGLEDFIQRPEEGVPAKQLLQVIPGFGRQLVRDLRDDQAHAA
jgi:hypothetical protein